MPVKFKELSPAKLNLFLKIISKREDGYHNLRSGITLINLCDEITAEKNSEFKIKYIGPFAPENNSFKDCIIEKIFSKFDLVKPNYSFTIKKNIPIQSGLGSASSNAAAILRILEKLNYQEIKKINLSQIGADVPFFVHGQDSLVRGVGDIMTKQPFPKYYFLIIKPKQNCSTVDMYNQIKLDSANYDLSLDTDEISEHDSGNDFEPIAEYKYKEISSLLKFMRSFPELIFSRLTGSGSCIYSTFESKSNAEQALSIFKKSFPEHWSAVVENNFI
tara:strand:+ start:247 stop:1071 length:825 start_codon:yes stop_codon:yes gene_type:complete